jgi:hypothetical protein
MTLNVALIIDNENRRKSLLEFASSQRWRVATGLSVQAALGSLRGASDRFEAAVAFARTQLKSDDSRPPEKRARL